MKKKVLLFVPIFIVTYIKIVNYEKKKNYIRKFSKIWKGPHTCWVIVNSELKLQEIPNINIYKRTIWEIHRIKLKSFFKYILCIMIGKEIENKKVGGEEKDWKNFLNISITRFELQPRRWRHAKDFIVLKRKKNNF